ncbi:hypothetical protein AGMMS49944_16310 [Spirochaetia bacterium]|nr:hypothetical protein AGMMS49944_16310 [Spirochaetia bacterium]
MKRHVFLSVFVFCVLFSVHALDLETAKNIITSYDNANKDSYVPALVEYGITERKVRSTGTYIGIYIQQLKPALNGSAIPSPDMYIGMIKAVNDVSKELSKQDIEKINLFFHDMADATRQLADIAKAEKEAEQQRIAAEAREKQAERQRLADEAEQKRIEERKIADAKRQAEEAEKKRLADEARKNQPEVQQPAATPRQPVAPDPHEGMIWVNGYTRKDGTQVRGYWRRK